MYYVYYITHVIQNDSTVQKEHAWNNEASLNNVLKMLAKLALLRHVLVSHG